MQERAVRDETRAHEIRRVLTFAAAAAVTFGLVLAPIAAVPAHADDYSQWKDKVNSLNAKINSLAVQDAKLRKTYSAEKESVEALVKSWKNQPGKLSGLASPSSISSLKKALTRLKAKTNAGAKVARGSFGLVLASSPATRDATLKQANKALTQDKKIVSALKVTNERLTANIKSLTSAVAKAAKSFHSYAASYAVKHHAKANAKASLQAAAAKAAKKPTIANVAAYEKAAAKL